MDISSIAQAVLLQLKRGPVWDGDVLSKVGRGELIKAGLATRENKFDGGPYAGCQKTELTTAGMALASRMNDIGSHSRN